MIEVTKEADAMICLLYKDYLERRQVGASLAESKYFGSDEDIQRDVTPNWLLVDVTELCKSLSRKGLLDIYDSEDRAYVVLMADDGISYMENRFKNKVSSVLEHISKIKNLIAVPFV